MIAESMRLVEKRKERFSRMGVASGKSRLSALEGREVGPRRIPPGKLMKVFMIHDPGTDEFHRYEVFKSYAGKRKIDLVIDRGTKSEKRTNGVSATWLTNKIREKLAMLAEIEED